jgi:hypothetical protein
VGISQTFAAGDFAGLPQDPASGGGDVGTSLGRSKTTDELFTAYHFAKYVEAVASVGKKEHLVPLYANAWLPAPPDPKTIGEGEDTASIPTP